MRVLLTMAVIVLLASGAFSQGKFSGYMFGDYFYNVHRDGSLGALSNVATPGTTAMQAFQLRRIYFAYDNDISEKFTSRFRLEVDQAALSGDGKIIPFVKDAFLRWKNVFNGSDLFFGIQPTPAFDVSEAAWGYRSLDKTIMDLRGIVAARDLGVALRGRLTDDGMLNYWVMVANGAGTSKPETDKYKRYYAHVQARPMQNLQLTVNFDYADRAEKTNPYQAGTKVGNAMTTISGFAGYTMDNINIGAEAFMQLTANGYDNGTSLASQNGFGMSLFGSYGLKSDLALVGRYDYFDPNTDTNTRAYGDIRNYVLAGISWKPDKNVSVIPNIQYETYETLPNGTSVDASLTARVTLYYIFL
ncbi:MAG: hypothetical protein WBD36_06310 [Bacteroidota bacterium]